MALWRICKAKGCNRKCKAPERYCEQHKYLERADQERDAYFGSGKQYIREGGDLYNTTEWRTMRRAQLIMYPQCAVCGRPATVVDHIVPHRGDEHMFFDACNLQSLCKECHDRKTHGEIAERKKEVQHEVNMRKRHGLLGDNYKSV